VHLYSIGYMDEDPHRPRFFAYLSLFTFAMLMLVTADNLVQLFFGWEGVGLASYLLIGFWYQKPSANAAAIKAFVVNRVGDFGFALGIFAVYMLLKSTDFETIFAGAPGLSGKTIDFFGWHADALTLTCLLLFMGAMGKSAQFLLHTWLPDAMEGPTPVSALIHAATMVTAGVYLIARSAPIYNATPEARTVVTIVGAITLLYGCIAGCGQDDLKRVLANSTVSQIGYMFLAVGLGPGVYAIGIIHLLGHGFFKAALFLSAGSVMHAMRDRINMRRFGGLWVVMPITFGVFTCGYLAIIGIPPFTGFFTKDKIIEAAFDKGGTSGNILGICALLGAGITAFYMTRALIMTFFGPRRWEEDVHPHEAPPVMTIPMIILGILSLVGGYLLYLNGAVQRWLTPSVGPSIEEGVHTISPVVLSLITLVVVLFGAAGAYVAFGTRPVPEVQPVDVTPVTVFSRRNLFADAFNENVLMKPGQWLTRLLVYFDNRGVDGTVNGLAAGLGGGSARARRVQTGFVRSYGLTMLGGSIAIVAVLLAVRFQ
jgi:NADH-quinone oxidoreductase subunit L